MKKFKKNLSKVLNTFENIMENGAFAPIFHNIFKYMIFERLQKALLWSKGLKWHLKLAVHIFKQYCFYKKSNKLWSIVNILALVLLIYHKYISPWLFSYNDGVPRSQCTRHIKRTGHTQFYAPTVALIKEFWLCPVIILHLFVLGKSVGHY